MDYQSVVTQLVEILGTLVKEPVAISEDTELAGQLALDSLQVMDLMLAVEDRFDISVPINALAEVKTVRDLALQVLKIAGQHP